MIQAPKIDQRTSHEIARDVQDLLPVYVENWSDHREGGELADALIHVFARFGELIVDRLNKTPEKNFLAFLDLVGISPLPLQAARAPLTFYLTAGATSDAIVPAGTQVAAPPGKGEQEPVVFETDKELVVIAAKLESLVLKDGGQDRFTDFSALLTPGPSLPGAAPEACGLPATGNVILIPHILYVPLPVYSVWPAHNQISIKVALDADLPAPIDPRMLRWELCIAGNSTAMVTGPLAAQVQYDDVLKTLLLEPSQDGTENLTKSGEVVFLNLPDIPFVVLEGLPGRWLRCRLLTPITCSAEPSAGMVREKRLPTIKLLTTETLVERTGLPIEQAFFNSLKLDLTKDFFPFGEKPKFGDTLYLASREALSNPDAVLTFHIAVTNASSTGPVPAARPQDTRLCWEFWDGKEWTELGTSEIVSRIQLGVTRVDAPAQASRIKIGDQKPEAFDAQFSDKTQVLSQTGEVSFKFPRPPAQLNVNGQNNYWVRVRIVAGDYGKEAHFEQVTGGFIERELAKREYVLTPASFAPPSIRTIKIDYVVTKESQPDVVLAYNDFAYTKINPQAAPFKPFIPVVSDEIPPSLYFGFTLPGSSEVSPAVFPNLPITVYVGMPPIVVGQTSDLTSNSAVVTWSYRNRMGWVRCTVLDDTQGLRRSGLIRFLAPSDFALSEQFGLGRYWLRLRGGHLEAQPQLRQVLLNTVIGVQGTTIANEILGASNETPSQQFRTTHSPVLPGQSLDVREPTKPSWKECAQIQADEGEGSIVQVSEPTGKGDAFWIRWTEVPNFYASGPRDRHYLLDRVSGQITFGDGTNGMIPQAFAGNIRLSYRTGGGTAGNKPAGAIAQLKSAIPYIQKVSNCEASSGGTDPEPDSALIARGPLSIRHGGRAVTREDFENLAGLASREVARAKCVPVFDLTQDSDAGNRRPGVVSLIIVPRSTDRKPRPSLDLFDRVRSYLDGCRQLTGDLVLVAPEYICVNVVCEITVSEFEAAGEVELAVRNALDCYLHPVTGGHNGSGWDFGREPRRSDLFGLLEGIPRVSHVRELDVSLIPDRPGSERTGRFLICSGNHKVTTTLEE